jgi:predicted ABC-type ATPase
MTPRLRVFAGPNGSGKSTIKDSLKSSWLGVYLNADDVEKELRENRAVDLSPFKVAATTEELQAHCRASGHLAKHKASWSEEDTVLLSIADGKLLTYSGRDALPADKIHSYLAATIVDFIREKLLIQRESFSFETVMSHDSKIEFIRRAQDSGFRTYLYFVATDDPEINVGRVAQRVAQNGHRVEEDLIRKRYGRSLDLLHKAVAVSNRAYIFDNSEEAAVLQLECSDGEMEVKVSDLRSWVRQALLSHADEQSPG